MRWELRRKVTCTIIAFVIFVYFSIGIMYIIVEKLLLIYIHFVIVVILINFENFQFMKINKMLIVPNFVNQLYPMYSSGSQLQFQFIASPHPKVERKISIPREFAMGLTKYVKLLKQNCNQQASSQPIVAFLLFFFGVNCEFSTKKGKLLALHCSIFPVMFSGDSNL